MKEIKVKKDNFNSVEGLTNECSCTACICHCDPEDLFFGNAFGLGVHIHSRAYTFNVSPD